MMEIHLHWISETSATIIVEVIAIAITTIESYLSVFEKANLVPLSFELEAQALARAVIPALDQNAVMIVDFGESRTGVSIAHKGRVFFTTTLDFGGMTLTNMIAKNFSLSFEKAEEMKRSYTAQGDSNANDIFPTIINGLSVLRDELNKHYIYWQTHEENGVRNEQINQIILCGGDANLAGLAEYLQASMKIEVAHANTWVNISDMKRSIPDMSYADSLGYATVLGLALGDYMYESRSAINVLPESEKRKRRILYRFRLSSMILSLSAVICALATLLIFPSYFYSNAKLALAEERLEAFNAQNPEIATHSLDTAIVDINAKLELLGAYKESDHVSDTIYQPLLASRTPGITFTQVFYDEKTKDKKTIKTIEVHGVASDRLALRAFESSLDASNRFTAATIPISNFLQKTNINFTVTLKPL